MCPVLRRQNFTSNGGGACYACSDGHGSQSGGQCQQCQQGQYSKNGSGCQSCSDGYISNQGASSCSPCAPGYYSNSAHTFCQECSAGTFQDKAGQTTCKDCPVGYWQEKQHMTYCDICPVSNAVIFRTRLTYSAELTRALQEGPSVIRAETATMEFSSRRTKEQQAGTNALHLPLASTPIPVAALSTVLPEPTRCPVQPHHVRLVPPTPLLRLVAGLAPLAERVPLQTPQKQVALPLLPAKSPGDNKRVRKFVQRGFNLVRFLGDEDQQ